MDISFLSGPYRVDFRDEKIAAFAPRLLVSTCLTGPPGDQLGHTVPLNYQQVLKLRDKLSGWVAANIHEGPPLWEERE